jgi:hypothetical protein
LVAVAVPTSAQAAVNCDNPPPDYTDDDFKSPMRFFIPEGDICHGNAVNNPYLAVGVITPETPKAFMEFASKNPPYAPIEFTSPGGNLLGALKLGELIRNGGYDTSLGKVCASACAYAIMGGIKRYVVQSEFDADSDYDNRNVGATGTKLGIHQFYQSDALNEPQKRAFSAIDKSADQLLMGILLEYTLRMGVDTRLVSVASSIPPWQEIRWLTPEEMRAWNVDNVHRHYSDLVFRSFGRSGAYVEVSNIRGPDASYLRIFCQNGVQEPLFTFVMDDPFQSPLAGTSVDSQIKIARDQVLNTLSRMVMTFELESGRRPPAAFHVQDMQGVRQSNGKIRIFAALRSIGFVRQEAERLTRVALKDNGDLSRSEWTFQDIVKFRIKGDHKLLRLAMKNCVD